jgi:hypothetical protein
MRSSLILLAIVLATLRLVQAALGRRVRSASLVPTARRRGSEVGAVELRLVEGVVLQSGTAEPGRRRAGRKAAGPGDRTSGRFAEWRYYGFSGRAPEADASVAEPTDIVAGSPAIGSVVTTLPDDCVNSVVDGRVYYQCGSVWYQRQYTGSNVTYVVVRAP